MSLSSSLVYRTLSLVLVLVVISFSFAAVSARAASVSPLRLELSGNPGQTVKSEFKVYNDQSKPQTLYIVTQNFETKDETGNPVFVSGKTGLASWISSSPTVTVPAMSETVIPFSISVPAKAEPGGYFSAIFASSVPPRDNGSVDIGLGYRIGTLILFRVNGDIPEGVNVADFATLNQQKVFTQLPITFFYRFQNSGADRIKPIGDIVIKNAFGRNTKVLPANSGEGSILPNSVRRFEVTWSGLNASADEKMGFWSTAKYQLQNFAFGFYTAELNLRYGVNNTSAIASYKFVVFPWQLTVVVLGGFLIILLAVWLFFRTYNRAIIRRARR